MSVTAQWANWIYPVPTRGIYWSGVDRVRVLGEYGGNAGITPTPYGLGINSPSNWEWSGSVVNTPGGFAVTRQVMLSVFYLYDATKLITTGRYPSLGVGPSLNSDPIGPSSSQSGLHWSNQSGEQRISASAGTDFSGVAATVTGVGNGLHVVVANITANGNTELYFDGDLVSTTAAGSYGRSFVLSPNFYWGGLGPANQNVGVILLAGIIYDQVFTAAGVQAFTANPFGYFFVDAPNRRRQLFSVISSVTIRPSSDVTTTGWTAYPDPPLYAKIDEVSPDDADYIISPSLSASPGPAVFGLNQSAPAGSYTINIRTKYTTSNGQFRVSLLDSGGTSVGTSAWTSASGSFTTYPIALTTTGTATQVKIEVQ